jgi:DNA-binding CsgD family transcriptional regulator
MVELTDFNASISNLDVFASLNTVGVLFLKNHYYSIVSLENYSENWKNYASLEEIGHFELNKQHYVILAIEPISKAPDSELTTLLSEREKQIALLVALGKQNKQIANQLNISEWTVSTHLRRIFTKLGVESRAAMVYRCFSAEEFLLNSTQVEDSIDSDEIQSLKP